MALSEWFVPVGWVIGPIVTGVIGVLIGNRNRSFDARRDAEASLIKAGPDIIDRLNNELGNLWKELRSTQTDLRSTQTELRLTQTGEQECRNELWALKQRIGRLDGEDG